MDLTKKKLELELLTGKVDIYLDTSIENAIKNNFDEKIADNLLSNLEDTFYYGLSYLPIRVILIRTHYQGLPMSKDDILNTLFHELIHFMLDDGCYNTESSNEYLVEWLGKNVKHLFKDYI